MSDTKSARKELQRFYALTDQLQVQLRALDEQVPSVRVEVRPFDGADVEGLAFIVLMEGAKSAQEDLRAVAEQITAVNAQKKKVRAALKQRPDRGHDLLSVNSLLSAVMIKAELERAVDEMKRISTP